MSNLITVNIIRETDKAVLAEDADGRQGWIQHRYLRDNNTVSETVWAKSVAWLADKNAQREAKAAFNDEYHAVKVAAESDKAIRVDAVFETELDPHAVVAMWFPKSQLNAAGEVPGWMWTQRIQDASRRIARKGITMLLDNGLTAQN